MQTNIDGYDGKYSVYDDGTIVNNDSGRTLYGSPDKNGYIKVRLYRSAKDFDDRYVHRIVADSFVEIPKCYDADSYETLFVIHIDGDKTNNHSTNLGWALFPETIGIAREKGRYDSSDKRKMQSVVAISGSTVKEFKSLTDASKWIVSSGQSTATVTGILNAIRQCLIGKSKQAYGFRWELR